MQRTSFELTTKNNEEQISDVIQSYPMISEKIIQTLSFS